MAHDLHMSYASLSSLCSFRDWSLPVTPAPSPPSPSLLLRFSVRLIAACQTRVYRKSKTKRQSAAAAAAASSFTSPRSKALGNSPPRPYRTVLVSYHTPKQKQQQKQKQQPSGKGSTTQIIKYLGWVAQATRRILNIFATSSAKWNTKKYEIRYHKKFNKNI